MKSSSVTIVMYHYVRDLRQTAYPRIQGLDVSFFRQQLGYFKKYYDFVTMQDELKCLRGEGGMRQDSILLTFDDGYKDHFEFVFPILDELGLQGSFFPSGKAIQEQIVLDVNKIHFIIEVMKEPRAIIRDIRALMDLHREQYRLFSFESYYKTLAKAEHLDTAEIVFIKLLLQKVLPNDYENLSLMSYLRNMFLTMRLNFHVSFICQLINSNICQNMVCTLEAMDGIMFG